LSTRSIVLATLRPRPRWAATWVLPAAALCDAVENGLHWWLTEAPRFGVPLAYGNPLRHDTRRLVGASSRRSTCCLAVALQ
jgi:hypothetical protein